ncbi:hypothetical protein C0992_011914 [Termitomyces sp. T32_za158]|nr:hypothetical protein C0992_011914 [Termitomyces sp. T32_za158]
MTPAAEYEPLLHEKMEYFGIEAMLPEDYGALQIDLRAAAARSVESRMAWMDEQGDAILRGVVQIGPDSEPVIDPDEEVFIIYSDLQSTNKSDTPRGLGYVDSRQDAMTISFELKASYYPNQSSTTVKNSTSQRARKVQKLVKIMDKTVQFELFQDKTALRSRRGDTGSILWKASIDFTQLILQQLHAQVPNSLLKASILKSAHVLELGAGTGLLAVALAPYVRHYTVTDIGDLQSLLRKNIAANFTGWSNHCVSPAPGYNVSVEELDWVTLRNTAPVQRRNLVAIDPVDLVLAVDCIYHPSLLSPLVETINYLAVPERTAVLVVVELRAEDVIREFLALWLSRSGWEIWRVGGGLVDKPYVMWLGWRVAST